MSDETVADSRQQKLAGREKARRFGRAGRGFLHAMTASRVKRQKDILNRVDQERQPGKTGEKPRT